jgi:uncharacterized SAM-binding protein YcdF (DUF218 family)
MLRRRLLRIALVGAALVVALWVALDLYLFVAPDLDKPTRADAVIVLAGDRTPRLDRGRDLMADGVAPVLVISDGLDPLWPAANRLCADGRGARAGREFRVVCFRPDPYSTRGEARGFAQLAKDKGWESVVIATTTFHVTRSRILFRRCFDGKVEGVGAPARFWKQAPSLVREVGKLLVQLSLARSC